MITTVTLSPGVDKTVALKTFAEDRLNRAESARRDPGGKGVNVSLALARLGENSAATGFLFDGCEIISSALRTAGVVENFVHCVGQVRENYKIFVENTGKTIEINEQNPEIPTEKTDELLKKLRKIAVEGGSSPVFVLSGSTPPGVPKDIYRRIIDTVKHENPTVKIILDCEGEALLEGLRAGPTLIKPNVEELERTFNLKLSSDEEIKSAARGILSRYSVEAALVSMGADGAAIVTAEAFERLPAVRISPKSAQGAGDAMVAGACLATVRGLSPREVLIYGICAAAGAVELGGTAFCDKSRFNSLLAQFGLEPI